MVKIIDVRNKIKDEDLDEVALKIKNGGIVIFPTETVYGIGVNGLDQEAVKKLYEVKKRPLDKPFSLLVDSLQMIKELTEEISSEEEKLIKKFFPGPLTLIMKKKNIVPDITTANTPYVGIRMPDNDITLALIKKAGVPIAAPSANISGKPSGTNIEDIKEDFLNIDYMLDAGEAKIGIASTIVKIENSEVKIIREGSISKEEIEECLKN